MLNTNLSFLRVHQFPEELPKIDFAFYKARLPNPALADQFQKAVSTESMEKALFLCWLNFFNMIIYSSYVLI